MKTPSRRQNPETLFDSRKYNTQCVCQICTCGRHHCPKNCQKPFEGETNYHHDYKPYTISAADTKRPCTHHYHERHYDPEALKTKYEIDYTPYRIENLGNTQPNKFQYKPRSGKFYDETEYKRNYQNKQIVVERPKDCCQKYTPNRGKFEGTTTYTAEFSPKKAENAYQPPSRTYERRKVPFQGKTTYDSDFKPNKIEPNQGLDNHHSCKCAYNPSKTKFEGQSNYKANYKPYEIEHEQHCPILDLPQYPRECSPGKKHVNYSAEKNKWI